MEVLDILVMRSPNYRSGCRKNLMEMKLNIEDWVQLSANRIDGFGASLDPVLPSLKSHRCSESVDGGYKIG